MSGLAILTLLLAGQDGTKAMQSGPIPKNAEPPVKPMLYKTASPAARADAVRTMQRFSQCVVNKVRPDRLDAYLRLPPGSSASNLAMDKIATDSCAPNRPNGYELRFQPNVMRANVYDALYRRWYKTGPIDISAVPKLNFAAEFDATDGPVSDAALYFRSIGDCVARAKPNLAHVLLMTNQGSNEEAAAIKAIVPSVAPCVPQGATLRFSAPILRGDIAEAMYKLSSAARRSAPAASATGGAK